MEATPTTTLYPNLIANDAINARETEGYADDIDELAALIATKGLLQPIVVRSGAKGKFEICDGRRRHIAIGRLIKAGQWPATQEVPIVIREESDQEALETSYVANIARRPMHPVQEFEIFSRLHDGGKGHSLPQIASRYGVTIQVVRQRLALGALAPELLKAWREGKITADAAKVFAAVSDKKRQIDGFRALQKQGQWMLNPTIVRVHFMKDRPTLDDARVRFVGLDAYKAKGGVVVETLFSDDGYVEDGKLLDKLVSEKLETRCKELLSEGWGWASSASQIGNDRYAWARLRPRRAPTAEEKEQIKTIEGEMRQIEARGDDRDDDARYDALAFQRQQIDEAIEARGFSKKQKAESGVIISLDGSDLRIEYGVVKGKSQASLDREKAKAAKSAAVDADDALDAEPENAISQALLGDITGWQTLAIAKALAQCPALAVRVAAAALAPAQGYDNYIQSPVRLTVSGMLRGGHYNSEDGDPLDVERVGSGFGAAFAAISEKRAANALAVNIARAIDVRRIKHKDVDLDEIAALVAAIPGDEYLKAMRAEFDPVDYFARASGKVALAALDDMAVSGFDKKAKKPVLAEIAAKEAKAQGWLPDELRHPDYAVKRAKKAA